MESLKIFTNGDSFIMDLSVVRLWVDEQGHEA